MLSGIGDNLNWTSVIIPKVPSDPINKLVKLYPAEVFLVLAPVLIISPLGKTTVKPEITVLIVPYLTAIVPEAEVDAIPPSAASAPGSIGKNTPSSLKYSFNCFLVTFACTLQSKSSAFTLKTLFIFSREIVIPFWFPTTWPSRDVPVPNGTTGILCSLQIFRIFETSSLVSGNTTAFDNIGL